jgi:hypothetical protein
MSIKADLERKAIVPTISDKASIKECVKTANLYYDKACFYMQDKRLEDAYVQFKIFVKVVLDIIMAHPDYKLCKSTPLIKEILKCSLDVSTNLTYYLARAPQFFLFIFFKNPFYIWYYYNQLQNCSMSRWLLAKAYSPIILTLLGIVSDENWLPWNACWTILVTLLGIDTLVTLQLIQYW